MNCYTKVTVEVASPECSSYGTALRRYEVFADSWDLNGDDMGELFRSLMMAMGFAEKTVNEVFGDDCQCYAEMDEDPDPGSGWDEPPANRLDEDDPPDWTPVDDPCLGCDVACEDTACLHFAEED